MDRLRMVALEEIPLGDAKVSLDVRCTIEDRGDREI